MKQLFQSIILFGLISLVACQKDNTLPSDTVEITDAALAANELILISAPPDTNGTGSDTFRHRGHGRGKHHQHPEGRKGDSIGFSDLPAAAQTYLKANANVDSIKIIVKITLKDGSIQYGVRMLNRKHYHFDANGAVIVKELKDHQFTEIAVTALPAAAQTYLTTNNLTSKVELVMQITRPDGKIYYGVRLTDNKPLMFDSEGNVLAKPFGKKHG
jgi:Putative beta-lactamase-inhibitor-like, PepSY-like